MEAAAGECPEGEVRPRVVGPRLAPDEVADRMAQEQRSGETDERAADRVEERTAAQTCAAQGLIRRG